MKYLVFGFGRFASGIAKQILTESKENHLAVYLRPSSIQKRAGELEALTKQYENRVTFVSGELTDEKIIKQAAQDAEIVIFTTGANLETDDKTYASYMQEVHVIDALRDAPKLKRYVPNAWAQVATTPGTHLGHAKNKIAEYLKKSKLPYTIIHCGWLMEIMKLFAIDGIWYKNDDSKIFVTALRDVVRLVPRIARDEQTLNHAVYLHGDAVSQRDIFELFKMPLDIDKLKSCTEQEYLTIMENKKKSGENTIVNAYSHSLWYHDGTRLGDAIDYATLYPNEKLLSAKQFLDQDAYSFKMF